MSVDQLEAAAVALGELLSDVVFLGGATVGLWRTDEASRPPRLTVDVDLVAEVTTLGAYAEFQEALRRQGFREDIESGVICRWRGGDELVLDAIPANPRLAGMSGEWLGPAVAAATQHVLPSGTTIRVVAPAWLLLLKLEAFGDRGDGDPLSSRDFEDVVLLVDGREELRAEVTDLPAAARSYVRRALDGLTTLRNYEYGIEGALSGPGGRTRALEVTVPRFEQLAR